MEAYETIMSAETVEMAKEVAPSIKLGKGAKIGAAAGIATLVGAAAYGIFKLVTKKKEKEEESYILVESKEVEQPVGDAEE